MRKSKLLPEAPLLGLCLYEQVADSPLRMAGRQRARCRRRSSEAALCGPRPPRPGQQEGCRAEHCSGDARVANGRCSAQQRLL